MRSSFLFFHSIAVVALCCVYTASHAGEIQLPAELPQLEVTAAADLGTLADDIGLPPGTIVPGFTVNDHQGNSITLEELKTRGNLLVVFYRGGRCPYCNRQIRQLTEARPAFKQREVVPVLISVDKPDAAAMAMRTYEIPFPVLSDPDLVVHDLFKVTMQLDDKLIPKYREYGINVEDWSGRTHHKFAVASVFLINQAGVVVWSHSALDYKTRPSVEQLLRVIDQHQEVL